MAKHALTHAPVRLPVVAAHLAQDRVIQRLLEAEQALGLPDVPGVYVFRRHGATIYVGESRRLRSRVLAHCAEHGYVFGVPSVSILWMATPDHKIIEKYLISVLHPLLNGKSSAALYFWRRKALGIPDTPDDLETAALRTAAEVLRVIANG